MEEEFNMEDLRTNNDTYYRMLGQFCSISPANKRSSDEMEAGPSQDAAAKKARTDGTSSDRQTSLNILSFPVEILDNILRYLDFGSLSKSRLACQSFKGSSERILNQGFQRLQNHVQQRFQHIKSQMPRRESARRKHPLARECDILETLHMRLTLLQMTFGKHVERGHCCFFAGEILDEVMRILDHVSITQSLGRAYKVTDELFDLTTMAMEYFKEKIEPTLPEITYFSTDFSDLSPSLSPGPRTIVFSLDSPSTSTSSTPPVMNLNSPSPPALAPSPPQVPKIPQLPRPMAERSNPLINAMRRSIRKYSMEVTILKRELKGCRRKVTFQHRQLQETQSKLEQHDRKIEEQNRKMEELLKEMQQCRSELACYRDNRAKHGDQYPRTPPGSTTNKSSTTSSGEHMKHSSSKHQKGHKEKSTTEKGSKGKKSGKGGPFKKHIEKHVSDHKS